MLEFILFPVLGSIKFANGPLFSTSIVGRRCPDSYSVCFTIDATSDFEPGKSTSIFREN